MKVQHHKIDFDLTTILDEELPYTKAFYSNGDSLGQDLKDLFAFPLANKDRMPVYTLGVNESIAIHEMMQKANDTVMSAVAYLLTHDQENIKKFFDCELIRNYPCFVDYAKFTLNDRSNRGIYGRYDLAYDPIAKKVKGIYELNADTPVMLFESTNLQNRICEQVTGDAENQYNSYWLAAQNYFGVARLGTKAVVFDSRYIEDTVTSETLAQVMGNVIFADLNDLDFDWSNRKRPWIIGETQVDTVFVLSPWEEMVASFPAAFENWKDWAGYTTLLEPAWRWFASHKGIWVYITHLMETDPHFKFEYSDLPFLRTYMTPDKFLAEGVKFVSKPVIGRLSMNIQIHDPKGGVEFESSGSYGDVPRVYQEFCEPCKLEGRNNFILGLWLSPNNQGGHNYHASEPATLCIREFDEPVLGLQNERFIPHILVNE